MKSRIRIPSGQMAGKHAIYRCVSGNIETKFLIVEHQKRTLFAITEHFITTNEQFECVYYAFENVIAHILLYY